MFFRQEPSGLDRACQCTSDPGRARDDPAFNWLRIKKAQRGHVEQIEADHDQRRVIDKSDTTSTRP